MLIGGNTGPLPWQFRALPWCEAVVRRSEVIFNNKTEVLIIPKISMARTSAGKVAKGGRRKYKI